jgi:hypothetical protein
VTFVRRLVLGSVLILVLTVGILFWTAERSLRQDLEGEIERTLASEAALVREALPADSTAWPAVVRRLAPHHPHRPRGLGSGRQRLPAGPSPSP